MGSHPYGTSTITPYGSLVNYVIDEGYAVIKLFDWTTKYINLNGGDSFGSPISSLAINSIYNWIVDNFNIRTDGVFAFGKSSGGRIVANLCTGHRGIPVLAGAALAPALGLTQNNSGGSNYFGLGYNTGSRNAHAEEYGFEGDNSVFPTGNTLPFPLSEQLKEYLRNNLPKTVGYNPMWNGLVNGDTETLIANDIDVPNRDYGYYSSLSRVATAPIKCWMAYDDGEIDVQNVDAFVKSIQNANGLAQVRILPNDTGGHNAVDSSAKALKCDIVTSLGINYNNMTLAYVEMVEWFRLFG